MKSSMKIVCGFIHTIDFLVDSDSRTFLNYVKLEMESVSYKKSFIWDRKIKQHVQSVKKQKITRTKM